MPVSRTPSSTDVSTRPYALQVAEDSSDSDIFYIGWADPGTATSEASWRIQRFTETSNLFDIGGEWADGNADFDNIWDDRETLSYS